MAIVAESTSVIINRSMATCVSSKGSVPLVVVDVVAVVLIVVVCPSMKPECSHSAWPALEKNQKK